MKRSNGFTVIEIISVILFLSIATVILLTQRANLVSADQDAQRKTAINAMYYSLEEVYYPAHKFYPATIDSKTLPSVDPALFTDPDGIALGDQASNYRYEAKNCNNTGTKCKSYVLHTTLQKEGPYDKKSRHNN